MAVGVQAVEIRSPVDAEQHGSPLITKDECGCATRLRRSAETDRTSRGRCA